MSYLLYEEYTYVRNLHGLRSKKVLSSQQFSQNILKFGRSGYQGLSISRRKIEKIKNSRSCPRPCWSSWHQIMKAIKKQFLKMICVLLSKKSISHINDLFSTFEIQESFKLQQIPNLPIRSCSSSSSSCASEQSRFESRPSWAAPQSSWRPPPSDRPGTSTPSACWPRRRPCSRRAGCTCRPSFASASTSVQQEKRIPDSPTKFVLRKIKKVLKVDDAN